MLNAKEQTWDSTTEIPDDLLPADTNDFTERNQTTKAQQLPWHGYNSAEMQGSRRDCIVNRLRRLCHQVWTSGEIPAD